MRDDRPDLDDLVGTDLPAAEHERLLRVHELLLAADPPPALAPRSAPVVPIRPRRRRRGLVLALAAAFALVAFAAGTVVGNQTAGHGVDFTVSMRGTPAATAASASLAVYDLDQGGNWPMEVKVTGLAPAASGHPYELWLTKSGKLAALCGSFRTAPDGSATVPMNAPYKFKEFDGWVVVEKGSHVPLLTT
jgi:hypothetical protein